MTAACVSNCGFLVDGDGNLSLNLGSAPDTADMTLGEEVFCDGDGKLRVPDYGAAVVVSASGSGNVDAGYAATGGTAYRSLTETSLSYTNNTARTQLALIRARALGSRIRCTAGNSIIVGHSLLHAVGSVAPVPGPSDYLSLAFLDPSFLTATGTGVFLDQGFPPGPYNRVVTLLSGQAISVRYSIGYRTGNFRSDSQNAVEVDGAELTLIAVS